MQNSYARSLIHCRGYFPNWRLNSETEKGGEKQVEKQTEAELKGTGPVRFLYTRIEKFSVGSRSPCRRVFFLYLSVYCPLLSVESLK